MGASIPPLPAPQPSDDDGDGWGDDSSSDDDWAPVSLGLEPLLRQAAWWLVTVVALAAIAHATVSLITR